MSRLSARLRALEQACAAKARKLAGPTPIIITLFITEPCTPEDARFMTCVSDAATNVYGRYEVVRAYAQTEAQFDMLRRDHVAQNGGLVLPSDPGIISEVIISVDNGPHRNQNEDTQNG